MDNNIIKIDEAGLKDDLKTLIRGTVGDSLNAMLDKEASFKFLSEQFSHFSLKKTRALMAPTKDISLAKPLSRNFRIFPSERKQPSKRLDKDP